MKGLESLVGHAHQRWQSACGRFRRSREVPAMSSVEALTYVTAKRIASRSWRCDPQDKERTQAEANPETKRCYQEVLSCLFTR